MAGLGRVHEKGGRAGGGQCGGDLAADVAALADAHDHRAPTHLQHALHGLGKALVEPQARRVQGRGFGFAGLAGQAQGPGGIKRAQSGRHRAILSAWCGASLG